MNSQMNIAPEFIDNSQLLNQILQNDEIPLVGKFNQTSEQNSEVQSSSLFENSSANLSRDITQKLKKYLNKLHLLYESHFPQDQTQNNEDMQLDQIQIDVLDFLRELDFEFTDELKVIDSIEKYSRSINKCQNIIVQQADINDICIFSTYSDNDFMRFLSSILMNQAVNIQDENIQEKICGIKYLKMIIARVSGEENLYIKYHNFKFICTLIQKHQFDPDLVALLVDDCGMIDQMNKLLNKMSNYEASSIIEEKLSYITFQQFLWLIVAICNAKDEYKQGLFRQGYISLILNIDKKQRSYNFEPQSILCDVLNQFFQCKFIGTQEQMIVILSFSINIALQMLDSLDNNLISKPSEFIESMFFEKLMDVIETIKNIFKNQTQQIEYPLKEKFEQMVISKINLMCAYLNKLKDEKLIDQIAHRLTLDLFSLTFFMLKSCQNQGQQNLIPRFIEFGLIDALNSYLKIVLNEEEIDQRYESLKLILLSLSQITSLNREDNQIAQLLIGNNFDSIVSKLFNICKQVESFGIKESLMNQLLFMLFKLSTIDKTDILQKLINMGFIESCYNSVVQYKTNIDFTTKVFQILENLVSFAMRNKNESQIYQAIQVQLQNGNQDRIGRDIICDVMQEHKESNEIKEIGNKIIQFMP